MDAPITVSLLSLEREGKVGASGFTYNIVLAFDSQIYRSVLSYIACDNTRVEKEKRFEREDDYQVRQRLQIYLI